MSDSLRPHESQHARPPCPSPTPERLESLNCLIHTHFLPLTSRSLEVFVYFMSHPTVFLLNHHTIIQLGKKTNKQTLKAKKRMTIGFRVFICPYTHEKVELKEETGWNYWVTQEYRMLEEWWEVALSWASIPPPGLYPLTTWNCCLIAKSCLTVCDPPGLKPARLLCP